jgi:hypothetical protein
LLLTTQNFYLTTTINTIRNALAHNNFMSAYKTISKSLSTNIIEAQSIALIRINKSLGELIHNSLPRGLASAIKDLHINTAIDLSTSESVNFNSEKSEFFLEAIPNNTCSAKDVNVLYSAIRLFRDLTEDDLFEFLNYLAENLLLGLNHRVGQKILAITQSIDNTIDFDSEYYFHGRPLGEKDCPFTNEDLLRAPHGITAYGRFNPIGQNYYYFSDQKIGAINEVRIHTRNTRVQVAKLKSTGKIKLIDISSDNENTFLKYCRFPFDVKSVKNVPREYLIPSFFSNCCKASGFDGIKYYGSQSYFNYVAWKDKHFDIVSHEIIEKR